VTISVLVIDDVPSHRHHFQHIFLQMGVYVLLAESAEEGLKDLEVQPVDAIFLDYNMPGMNGFEFIAQCQLLEGRAEIPIIMMSSDMIINETAVAKGLAQAWVSKRAKKETIENVLKTLGVM
jgi:CheY-like chemotaxis protein